MTRRQFFGAACGLGSALAPRAMALEPGEPSRTAKSAAAHRAAHQLLDKPIVFDDPLALAILGAEARSTLETWLSLRSTAGSRAMRAFIVARSRFAEDQLASAASRGVRQYVVLGAGLDTFAHRNPLRDALTVYEVDHPATQAWKRRRLAAEGIATPAWLRYVAVDFEKQALGPRLQAEGFQAAEPAFTSWLGVSMYLTREAVTQTLAFVAKSCAPGSAIVFDYMLSPELLDSAQRERRQELASRVAAIGEPWLSVFHPLALAADLRALGFGAVEELDAREASDRYFKDRADGLRVVGDGGRILYART